MAHCRLQGNRGSKLRWHTFSRCWFQTNTTAQGCVKPYFRLLTSFLPLSICAAPSRGAAAAEGNDALCAIDVGLNFGPSTIYSIDAADLNSLPVAALEEEEEEEAAGDWDTAVRRPRMPVGTRVFVDEGTAPGVRGPRTFPFFAVVSRHLSNTSRCWFQTNTTAQAACGSTRGMDRAGIGVFSEVTGACRELKIHHFLPFDCSPPSQYNLWGLCSFYFA
jgi:hypothetical protein